MYIGYYRPQSTYVYYDAYSRLCRLWKTYRTYIDLCITLLAMAFCHFSDAAQNTKAEEEDESRADDEEGKCF